MPDEHTSDITFTYPCKNQPFIKQWEYFRTRIEFLQNWALPDYLPKSGISKESKPDCADVSATKRSSRKRLDKCLALIVQSYTEALNMQQSIAAFQLRQDRNEWRNPIPIRSLKGGEQTLFVRAFHDGSRCRYDPDLGFICSNFKAWRPRKSFKSLIERSELNKATLRNHCGGCVPTRLISVTSDPIWLWENLPKMWSQQAYASGQVAFIKADVLSQLGILYEQSDLLVEQVGARCWHPDNPHDVVQYCHSLHWMVYGWIPQQAISATVSLHDFTRACEDVRKQKGRIFYASPEDVLEQIQLDQITGGIANL